MAQEDADRISNEVYERRWKFCNDTNAIESDARDASKMRRIARNKLMESGAEEEQKLLHQLKIELEEEFGKDLWEPAMERQRGHGTTEDIYWWYKKQVGQTYTKSELKMRGIKIRK